MVTESKSYKTSIKAACDASLEVLRKNGLEIRELREDFIKATSGPSLSSWGEDIQIQLTRESPNNVKITVSSSPRAQLFDWGKSSDNVSKIFSGLEIKLSKSK